MNLYDIAEPAENGETFLTLHQTANLKIEAIRSRLSLPGKMYHQEEDEWVVLILGEAVLEINGDVRHLLKGDALFLARHTPHRVLSTSEDALWIGVFSS